MVLEFLFSSEDLVKLLFNFFVSLCVKVFELCVLVKPDLKLTELLRCDELVEVSRIDCIIVQSKCIDELESFFPAVFCFFFVSFVVVSYSLRDCLFDLPVKGVPLLGEFLVVIVRFLSVSTKLSFRRSLFVGRISRSSLAWCR
jgi:hypothetical protein